MKKSKLFFVVLTLLNFLWGPAQAENNTNEAFHLAKTSAEKKLAQILSDTRKGNEEAFAYITSSAIVSRGAEKKYLGYISPSLRHKVTTLYKSILQRDCGGTIADNEICGFDVNIFTCTQDDSEYKDYEYRTISETDELAVIRVATQETLNPPNAQISEDHGVSYRMIKSSKSQEWLLDDIGCLHDYED